MSYELAVFVVVFLYVVCCMQWRCFFSRLHRLADRLADRPRWIRSHSALPALYNTQRTPDRHTCTIALPWLHCCGLPAQAG